MYVCQKNQKPKANSQRPNANTNNQLLQLRCTSSFSLSSLISQ